MTEPVDRYVEDLYEINKLKDRVQILEEAVRELLIYASPIPKESSAAIYRNGYTSELVPRFTQLGAVKVADRIEAIRSLVIGPDKKGDEA